MKDEKYIIKFINNLSNNEICKLRENYKNNKKFDDYLFEASGKIFRKLIFPYFRFEILLNCIIDIKENNKYYPKIKKEEIDKINTIYIKLQEICSHLNIALDEYNKILDSCHKSYD